MFFVAIINDLANTDNECHRVYDGAECVEDNDVNSDTYNRTFCLNDSDMASWETSRKGIREIITSKLVMSCLICPSKDSDDMVVVDNWGR